MVPILLCDCCYRRFFHCKIHIAFSVVWSSISSHFCLIAFSTVQVWWLCVHARQCTMQCTSSQGNSGWSSKRCSWLCSGKDVWQHGHQLNTFSVKHLLRLLITLCFFAFWRVKLLCLVSPLKYEISTWISVYISKYVCLLNINLVWFTSTSV